MSEIALIGTNGARKYLCGSEVTRFLAEARTRDRQTYLFCALLAFTGCRLSEALALTPRMLDANTQQVTFKTLKRRREFYRSVPIPLELSTELLEACRGSEPGERIWTWCRQTAWRRVKAVMVAASIEGLHAMPKGLRHGFGVANAEHNIPMGVTQRWLGHAKLETTAIYQQAKGREERAFASRIWHEFIPAN